jgi:glycosyltransferase involved in cell wall biosynthesis
MYKNKKKIDQIDISCVIATHNRDNFLKQAIKSAIKQTHPPIEIIIVNNIPNKRTKLIVKIITKTSSIPIKYIEHSMMGKGSISKNLGASKCKSKYIAFLDDDDIWEKDYLREMIFLISKKKSKITYAYTWKIRNNKKTPHKKLKKDLKMKDFILSNPGCQVSNLIVDKNLFIGLGGFDDCVIPSNDKDFLMRALYFGYEYHVLKKNLVVQNKHTDEQVTDFNKEFLIGIKKFYRKHEWVASPIIRIKFWIKYWKIYLKILFSIKKIGAD